MSTNDNQPQVVFIDSRTPDISDLLAGLQPGELAFVIDPSSDGLDQIAAILAANNLTNLASISIVSHGTTGELALGTSLITDGNLSDNASALATIGAALAPGGAIQLYGCDVATGQAGQQFINDFSALAGGAVVDASTHLVGSAALGGSWALDASSTDSDAMPSSASLATDAGDSTQSAVPAPTSTSRSSTTTAAAAPFTANALADFQGELAAAPTGQLFFRINQGNDVQLGAIDNTSSSTPHTVYIGGGNTSGVNGNETSIAVDTAAGLVFSVGVGNAGSYDAFSVHNLNTGALIETVEFGANTGSVNTDDIVQALALNTNTDTLYVGDWGVSTSDTGVAEFTYNPHTGLVTPITTGTSSTQLTTTIPGSGSTITNPNGMYLFTSSQLSVPAAYTNANAFFLDSANNKLYYVNDDTGYNFSPFSPTNGVYVVNTNGPTFTATELTSNGSATGRFPTATGGGGSIGAHGNIVGLAVDVADGDVFFESTDVHGSGNIALWWVSASGANQTATQITLPSNVNLTFAGQTTEGGDAAGLTFDPSTKQLYLTNADNSNTTSDLGAIYQLQWNPTTHTVAFVNTYDTNKLVGGASQPEDAPSTTTFDILPTLATSGTANQAFERGAAVTLLSATPSITDPDNTHLASATVQITGGTFTDPPSDESSAADDHLTISGASSGFVSGTSISFSYSSATETLTLTGYDTLADYATALAEVQYNTTGHNPTDYGSDTTRVITWQVNDGALGNPVGADNVTSTTLTVVGINDPPTLTNLANATYTEEGPFKTLSPSVTVADVDDLDLKDATVAIVGGTFANDGDVLAATTTNTSITASYNSTSETLILSGTDTLAHYQSVLASVTFHAGENPTNFESDQTRIVTWVAQDPSGTANGGQDTSSITTTTLTVVNVNDPPTLTGVAASASFTEEHGAVPLSSTSITVSDPDDLDLKSATVSITSGGFTGDVLSATSTTSISVSYDSTNERLILSGTDTLANYQSVLDTVTFNAGENPTDFGADPTRTITWVAQDPSGTANSGLDTSPASTTTLSVINVNDPPTLTGVASSASFTEESGGKVLSPSVTVTDVDDLDLKSATVSITAGGFTGDVLSATSTTSISVSYDSTSERLILSGTDTLAHYQSVLDSVTFNAGENPTDFGADPTRTITWVVQDPSGTANSGSDTSSASTMTLSVTNVNDPPTLTGVAASTSFTEESGGKVLSPSITVTDADDLDLKSATVSITAGGFAGDVLSATSTTSISVSYDSTSERLILSGTDTLANYQSVLDTVTFNAGENPTDFGADPTRTITWVAVDPSGTANGGSDTSTSTTTLSVINVNDPPTLANVASGVTGASAVTVTLSPSVTVTDPDNLDLASATISITAGTFTGDGDVLSATSTTSISVSYDSTHERLILSGSDTLAHYQSVLDTVTFDTNVADPTDGGADPTRTVSWVLNDGSTSSSLSTPQFTTITLQQGPKIGPTPTVTWTEEGSATPLSPSIALSDTNGTILVSATVSLASADLTGDTFSPSGQLTNDQLAFSTSGTSITASYDGATETLLLTGSDTIAHYQSVLDSVAFSSGENPTNYGSDPTRIVTWTVNDGATSHFSATATSTIDVNEVNDPPTLTGVAANASFREEGGAVPLSNAITVTDPDDLDLTSATVSITAGGFTGDVLSATSTTSISVSYDSTAERLILSGTDTLASYQSVLDSVTFNAGENPTDFGADPTRTITWVAQDPSGTANGGRDTSPVSTTTLSVINVNDPPTLTGVAANASFREEGGAVPLSSTSITVTDADDLDLTSATVSVTAGGFAGDVLSATSTTSISVSYDSTSERLILSGTDTLAHYQSVLDSVTFNAGENPTGFGADPTRTITWTVQDPSGTANSGSDTSPASTTTLSVINVNDPPTLTGVAANASFTEEHGAVPLSSTSITVSDPDDLDLKSATVSIIAGGFTGDVLSATSTASISVSYDSTSERLILSGTDTLANYQSVLDTVTFNAGENPTDFGADPTRTITWVAQDPSGTANSGLDTSPASTTTLSVINVNDPPTLTGVATSASFREEGGAVPLSNVVTVTDADDLDLKGATVSITAGGFAGDVLAAVPTGNITVSYNSTTETLTLSGTDTLAHYQSVLDSVTFNAGENPTGFGADPTRTITWTVQDPSGTAFGGVDTSSASTTTLSVINVNDPPTLMGVATSASFTEESGGTVLSPSVTVTDADDLDLTSATVSITAGGFTGDVLSATSTTSISVSYDSTHERLILTGSDTLAHYQSVLDTVTFNAGENPTDFGADLTRTITWVAQDPSGTANGGSDTSSASTTTLSVINVNDPPTLSSVAVSEVLHVNHSIVVSPNLSVSDPDNLTLAGATVSIAGGFAGDGDLLGATTRGSISASYNSTSETLILSGSDTLADYTSVLDSVTFSSGPNQSNGGANPTRTITWTVNDGSGSNNTASAATTVNVSSAKNDFNGDLTSDIAFQDTTAPSIGGSRGGGTTDPTAGDAQIFVINNGAMTSKKTLTAPATNAWRIVGSADFNGDGNSDIVWQNTSTNAPIIWTMNGTTYTNATTLASPGASWSAVATGDFNGDGNPDLLFQNTSTGAAEIWTMNGVSVTSMTTLAGPGSTWHVAATGDFNGDGKSDILFQNSDGTPEVWLMNGTSVTTAATLNNPGSTWHIVATADFNQDGDADILFQNTSTGAPMIWTMNGTSVTSQTTVGNPGAATGLALIGAGEYNGNGQPELLFQNTGTGAPVIWTMSGTSVTGSTTLANPGGSNWHANTG